MGHLTFSCRSTGGSCEWAMEDDSREIILLRFAEHQKCAHHVSQLSRDMRDKAEAAIRAV
jgi:predicted small metal-binding protein